MHAAIAARAERLARHRAIAAIVVGILLGATQGQRMDAGGAGPAGWIAAGVTILLFMLWASGLFHGRALRDVLNDEGSDLNRRRSLVIGFWTMLAAAITCYLLTFAKAYGARDAIQIVMTVGMSAALISFGVAELGGGPG